MHHLTATFSRMMIHNRCFGEEALINAAAIVPVPIMIRMLL